MNTKLKLPFYLALLLLSVYACDSGPKVIPASNNQPTNDGKTGIFSEDPSNIENSSFSEDLHTVKVYEVLKTPKYLYLNVTENEGEEPFWIATRLMEVTVGETYFYKGGLLKTNFESKEFNRVFDKIYLISSNLVQANHANNPDLAEKSNSSKSETKAQSAPSPVKIPSQKIDVKGSVKISELVKNVKTYEGKTIQISGVCTKINANIMGKNWIHLRDGSKDEYDLVVTSNEIVNEGDIVTMKAVVTLNKDFGAGYKYDLILEEGTIIK